MEQRKSNKENWVDILLKLKNNAEDKSPQQDIQHETENTN